jgi:hypothetical protein
MTSATMTSVDASPRLNLLVLEMVLVLLCLAVLAVLVIAISTLGLVVAVLALLVGFLLGIIDARLRT